MKSYILRESILNQLKSDSIIPEKQFEKLLPFDDELINSFKKMNVPMPFIISFYNIFKEGLNIGSCGFTSRYLSFLFESFTLVEFGTCELVKGTEGAPNGEHSWIISNGFVYDTTLMLKIDEVIALNFLGYTPRDVIYSEDLLKDELYLMQKDIVMDYEMVIWKKRILNKVAKIKKSVD